MLDGPHMRMQHQATAPLLTQSPSHAPLWVPAVVLDPAERLNSFNSTMSSRVFDRTLSQQALLGPRRPRPHKIWRKKFIKVRKRLWAQRSMGPTLGVEASHQDVTPKPAGVISDACSSLDMI